MKIKVSRRDLKLLEKDVERAVDDSMSDTYHYFRDITPKRSGNARRRTKYNKNKHVITANYPYAGRLDTGWSSQAPKGMTIPSLAYLVKQLRMRFGKVKARGRP